MLCVDIIKHLPQFDLKVKLEVGTEKLGLLGGSGSGKSMTLKCIAGIERPDQGTIILGDKIFYDSKKGINIPPQERNVGYLFQNYALFPHMTVMQNILTGMTGLTQKEKETKAQKLIQELHLFGLEKHYPKTLSGGEQQRVAIGRMLAAEPQILMFDEPFSALDYHLKEKLQNQLLDLLDKERLPALLVSHDIDEVYRLCSKIAVIKAGKIELMGTKKEVFDRPARLSAAQLTGCKNISKIKWLKNNEVLATDWGITLKVPKDKKTVIKTKPINYIGIRAHHLTFVNYKEENAFPCKLIKTSETRFGMTMIFTLKETGDLYEGVITLEMDKGLWERLGTQAIPPYIKFPEEKLMLIND